MSNDEVVRQPVRCVYIIGAGFSRLVGFPLASELFAFIKRYSSNSPDSRDIRDWPRVEDFFSQFGVVSSNGESDYDIELTLTYLDLAILSKKLSAYDSFFPSIQDAEIFREQVSGILLDTLSFFQYGISRKPLVSAFEKFFYRLREGDAIIDFNYDCLPELYLWLSSKWYPWDGYGISLNKNEFFEGGECPSNICSKRSIIPILKLHGSINWLRRDHTSTELIICHWSCKNVPIIVMKSVPPMWVFLC